ncbi:hypothetical protein ACGC1H_006784 [Rhizoctonia solani]
MTFSKDELLNRLNPSTSALYGSEPNGIIRQYCAKDTRKTVFQELDDWSNASSSHLLWMNGMAGTGKTTIAHSYARLLSERRTPTACFFCSRVDPTCRKVRHIIPTIVYQLAILSEVFRNRLGNLLRKAPLLASLTSIPHQFENLLEAPFKDIGLGQVPEGIVVIIDALDECDDSELQLMKPFLDHLVKCAEGLPLKFLITSRPEPWIRDIINPVYDKLGKSAISLHDVAKKIVQEDIKLYLERELAPMSLSNEELVHLVEQCDSLFLYAATLVRYIRPGDPSVPSDRRLRNVLQPTVTPRSTIHAVIDELYSLVLKNALGDDLDQDETDVVKVVLDIVVCANEPISIKTIAALSGLRDDEQAIKDITFTLERLRSVIYISKSNSVSVFHASFPEFMFDRGRAGELFYCPRVERNHLMTKQCFGLMKELRFNICPLDSSYAADKDAVTQSQVENTIKPTLWYACRYWAEHLEQTTHGDLCSELKGFLSRRLLFWMEVLNLKEGIALGGDILLRAILWLTKLGTDADLTSLAEDARNFVTSFAANPISISTPHIYTSLLPFCPRSSAIYKCYREHFQGLAEPDQHAMRVREVAALASWKSEAKVSSVAYSHDGTKIAFGCLDGAVGVQSSYDGTSIFDFDAHDKPVWSVAFSPKSKIGKSAYIASGSDDGTIRIWNALDGTVRSVCRPTGTADPGEIKSIAFSPKCDGSIASGSSDCTVCIWDSSNGKLIAEPFRGHTGAIWAVAFSPDGTLVASGSDDHTIRIWNPQNGQLMFDPLKAQRGDINTIAFSPDGARMVSGSSDRTVCVWDPIKGAVVVGPFPAHNDKVTSVAFSPNGKHLASGSLDRTIRVWDPLSGEFSGGPFEGHIGPINSIAFSPDSTRIASGSSDGTIRLWDPRQGTLSDDVLKSHSDAVSSVAFSPSGQHIASCSYDGTVRLWDVCDNLPVAGGASLGSHDKKVTSLAFSSDGARVVTGSVDRTARVWDIHHANMTPVIFKEHDGAIWSVTFSPDDSFVASTGGSGDDTIRLWNSSTGASISAPLMGHTDEVLSVAISPDGTNLTSGSRDKTLRVWDLKSKELLRVLEGHTRTVWSVVYSRDGTKLASSSSDGTILVWGLQNDPTITSPTKINTPSAWVSSVAFSPDGDFIASGADDCAVRLWRSDTGESVGRPYEGHFDQIWSVAFSPSGTHIVSGSHDGTIRFWDIKNTAPPANGHGAGANAIAGGEWELQSDGWIKQGSNLLLWVPHEVATSLVTPHCSSVISSCGPLWVDFSNLKLGKLWQECYVPQPDKWTHL